MKRRKMVIRAVRWVADEWQSFDEDGLDWAHPTKKLAVAYAAAEARYDATPEQPISLRIYKKNGQIQEERTYPRSADPRRSKG